MSDAMTGALASHHYFDRDFNRMAVKLLPGEYFVTTGSTVLLTVLGSCVAACLQDPHARVAGMNHFMLPDDGDSGPDAAGAMRYGSHAMDVLLREMVKAGAQRGRLQAKVFGGAAVLPNMPTFNIGDRNADFVLRYLRAEQIDVHAQDLGGAHARRLCFLPESGKAVVRRLRTAPDIELVRHQDADLLRRLADLPARGARPAGRAAWGT